MFEENSKCYYIDDYLKFLHVAVVAAAESLTKTQYDYLRRPETSFESGKAEKSKEMAGIQFVLARSFCLQALSVYTRPSMVLQELSTTSQLL